MTDETKTLETTREDSAVEKTERLRERRVSAPRTDIFETKDGIMLVMDVPGADDHTVDVTVEKDVLTVSAYPVYAKPENHSLAYSEYGEWDYQRSFNLSNELDRNRIDAKVKDGVLYLHLAKAAETKPHKVTVKAG